jgi:adenylosuccinate lyase
LGIYNNVAEGLVVYPKVINAHIMAELPFMATENIMMDTVKYRGGNRQELHEIIRTLSMQSSKVVKEEGGRNDLVDRIASEPVFGLTKEDIMKILEPKNFVGRAPQQVEEYIEQYVKPVLDENKDSIIGHTELTV